MPTATATASVTSVLWASDDDTYTTDSADPMTYFTDVDTIELDVGVRSLFRRDKFFKPYVGGGLAFIKMDAQQTVSGSLGFPGSEYTDTILDDSDTGVGIWIDAGILFQWKSGFNVGADVRYSSAAVQLSAGGLFGRDRVILTLESVRKTRDDSGSCRCQAGSGVAVSR